jgi:hypothetical protein
MPVLNNSARGALAAIIQHPVLRENRRNPHSGKHSMRYSTRLAHGGCVELGFIHLLIGLLLDVAGSRLIQHPLFRQNRRNPRCGKPPARYSTRIAHGGCVELFSSYR